METIVSLRNIGTVIADEVSPSFDVFRFKALAKEYVYPGTLVGAALEKDKFLIGRISASIEVNPHESASRTAVRDAMDIEPDYPEEGLSTSVYRVYEADIIEEGLVRVENEKPHIVITEPSDMAKAGTEVFIPSEEVIAQAMGFEQETDKALCLGRTRITAEDVLSSGKEANNNVLLKPDIIQRHIFIGGTTGSGKSYATGIILEEISKFKLPIVILDSQQEYTGLAIGLGGIVLTPGQDYSIELSSLMEREISELVPTVRGTQMEELLVFTYLRLKREMRRFTLNNLLSGMENDGPILQLQPRTINPAISRVRHYIGRHNFIGNPSDWKSLLQKYTVININCTDLDQSQLQLVVGATLRELTNQRIGGIIPPFIGVLDEAHLLVPESEDSPCKQVIRENVRIGRHYGICMILITQSPVDIDKKTIRQCNTRFIFALEPDQLDSLRGIKADATEDMLKRLPKMPRGTCLLSGTYETIKHAIPIKIRSDRKTKEGGGAPDIFREIREKWKK